ncbi:MAG: tail fiber protein [Xanthobacteraceae bacterium]
MEQYLGEIRLLSFNFAPKGWAQCGGQLLPINQYQALFALLGTQFGGNGTTNFALPDMRSRVPIHTGSSYVIGQTAGSEQAALNISQIPQHNHMLQAVNSAGTTQKPINHLLGQSGSGNNAAYAAGTSNLTALNPASIQQTGGNQGHSNLQPYLAMNYCVALQGIFPSRN